MSGAQCMPAALLQQVLDVYRQPLRYRALWDDPHYALPEGVGNLLDLANASPDVLAGHAERLFTSREELAAAIHFFIHHALLAEGRDAYRVLGLTPAATSEQVKLHYYKLMRLYHPDRDAGGEWHEVYAPRINQAYRRLRHSDGHRDIPRVKPVFLDNAERFPVSAFPQHYASPRIVQQAVGHPIRSGTSRWRRRGLVMSCVAVAAGVGFILWNLFTWPMLAEPSSRPPMVAAIPVEVVNLPPVLLPPLPENAPPPPIKSMDSEIVPAVRSIRIVPKRALQPNSQSRRHRHRYSGLGHRSRRHRAR